MRLLIVDDAPAGRAILTSVVTSLGHEVVAEAADAPRALDVALAERPDAIAIDGRLPGDAARLIADLRAAVPLTRLLVVAALGESALVQAALQAGADGVLARPFLRSRVASALTG